MTALYVVATWMIVSATLFFLDALYHRFTGKQLQTSTQVLFHLVFIVMWPIVVPAWLFQYVCTKLLLGGMNAFVWCWNCIVPRSDDTHQA